jgi:hypothetical protein
MEFCRIIGFDLLVQPNTYPNSTLILLKYQKKKSCGLKAISRLHGDDKQNTYKSKIIVVAIGAANFSIDGLMSLSSHIKIIARKTKNQLHNTDHKVAECRNSCGMEKALLQRAVAPQ